MFRIDVDAVRPHRPLIDRHLRLLLLDAWGFPRETVAQACDITPRTLQTMLWRIRKQARPLLASRQQPPLIGDVMRQFTEFLSSRSVENSVPLEDSR